MGEETVVLNLSQYSTAFCVAVLPHRTLPHKARPARRHSIACRRYAGFWAEYAVAGRCRLLPLSQVALLAMEMRLGPYRSRVVTAPVP